MHNTYIIINFISLVPTSKQLSFSFGFTQDDGDDIDRVNDELSTKRTDEVVFCYNIKITCCFYLVF